MDGRMDGRTYENSPLCPTGHRPFGAAAQKVVLKLKVPEFFLQNLIPLLVYNQGPALICLVPGGPSAIFDHL